MLKLSVQVLPYPAKEKHPDKVFTIKAVETAEDLQQMEVPLKQGEPVTLFVKATIPELETTTDITGILTLQVDELNPLTLPIQARGEVPQVICLKELEDKRSGTKIIKIPSKGTMKIPFKNLSNINFSFEVRVISREPDKPDSDGVRISVLSGQGDKKEGSLRVDANSTFCVPLEL